jgi:hypothetical protein
MSGIVRLNVNITEDVADALKAYSRAHDCTVTEATRRAVSLLNLIDVEFELGHRLAFVNKRNKAVKVYERWAE